MSSCYRYAMQACAKSYCDRFDACYSVVDAITFAVVWLSVPAWHVSIMIYPLHAVVMHAACYLSWRISAIHWCCMLCMLSMMPGMSSFDASACYRSIKHTHADHLWCMLILWTYDAHRTCHWLIMHAIDLWYMLMLDLITDLLDLLCLSDYLVYLTHLVLDSVVGWLSLSSWLTCLCLSLVCLTFSVCHTTSSAWPTLSTWL
jgi:hypothetical protein